MKLNGKKRYSVFHDGPLPIHVSKVKQAYERTLYSSHSDIIISYKNTLVTKDFLEEVADEQFPDPTVRILRNHSSKIICIGLANYNFLLCTCSEDAVYLWKKDSLLREWSRKKVVRNLGKILHCCLFATDKDVFICLSKSEEIIIIRCVSHINLEPAGSLDLSSIEMLASIDKIREPNFWIKCFAAEDKLRVVGLAHGNGISLRLWDGCCTEEDLTWKLIDHKTVPQIKTVVSTDMMYIGSDAYIVIFGTDGQVEILLLSDIGMFLINRLKIDDSLEERRLPTLGKHQSPTVRVEFRLLTGRFLKCLTPTKMSEIPSMSSQASDAGDSDHENGDGNKINNSLMLPSDQHKPLLCPKLLALVASTRKISIMNLRSGEIELAIKYEELDKNIGLLVNTITLNYHEEGSEIVGALQLLMDKNLYFFRIGIDAHDTPFEDDCFLISGHNDYNLKSVLRKKLKSPKNLQPKASKSLTANNKRSKFSSKVKVTSSPSVGSFSIMLPASHSVSSKSSYTVPSDMGRRRNKWNCNKEMGDSPNLSPRATTNGISFSIQSTARDFIDFTSHASYRAREILVFDSIASVQLPAKMSESGISSIRLAQSHDGRYISAGANVSPLLVLKRQPFDTVRLYKDIPRVSSLHFSFSSQHLLVATNDAKTTMLDWRKNKELLEFKFSSKFNEHVGAQFYFMDKFVLQPEENRLAFYSYALRDTGNGLHLQAGSFPLNCQSITAIAAANQFYSNFIMCGLSTKAMQVFDANAEKVCVTIPQAHSRPISCIRLNEAPKSSNATELSNFILTSAPSSLDPIKLWDLRSTKSVTAIGDVNINGFVSTTRPALSPCGRYIASGFEDNKVIIYDVRKINSRVHNLQGIKSTVLDCIFDPESPVLWCAARNGELWSYIAT